MSCFVCSLVFHLFSLLFIVIGVVLCSVLIILHMKVMWRNLYDDLFLINQIAPLIKTETEKKNTSIIKISLPNNEDKNKVNFSSNLGLATRKLNKIKQNKIK